MSQLAACFSQIQQPSLETLQTKIAIEKMIQMKPACET